mgnify:CR=1 FL=1
MTTREAAEILLAGLAGAVILWVGLVALLLGLCLLPARVDRVERRRRKDRPER